MGHRTRYAGAESEILGGRTLVGGTAYEILGGRTRVGGTGYDISFTEPVECTITLSGTGGTITYNGTEQTESFTAMSGEKITIQVKAKYYGKPAQSNIYLNGTLVKQAMAMSAGGYRYASYDYTVTTNATIKRSITSTSAKYSEDVRITEETE